MTPTVIEQVAPRAPSSPVRIDAWRWTGVPGFEQYREHVLRAESERAARRAAQ